MTVDKQKTKSEVEKESMMQPPKGVKGLSVERSKVTVIPGIRMRGTREGRGLGPGKGRRDGSGLGKGGTGDYAGGAGPGVGKKNRPARQFPKGVVEKSK